MNLSTTILKNILMGFVLIGMLAQPCQANVNFSKIRWANHSLNAVLTLGAAGLGLFAGYKWYPSYAKKLEEERDKMYEEKTKLQIEGISSNEGRARMKELRSDIKDIDDKIKNNDSTYKTKTMLYAGTAAAGLAYMVDVVRTSSGKPVSSITTSSTALLGRVISSASFGIAASGASYALTNVVPKYFMNDGNKLQGAGIILGFVAAVIAAKVVGNWLTSSAVKENIQSIVKDWKNVAKEHSLEDKVLTNLSTALNKREPKVQMLSDKEIETAHTRLKALGFNKEMNGLVVKR